MSNPGHCTLCGQPYLGHRDDIHDEILAKVKAKSASEPLTSERKAAIRRAILGPAPVEVGESVVLALLDEIEALQADLDLALACLAASYDDLDAAQLRLIEASNPGIALGPEGSDT